MHYASLKAEIKEIADIAASVPDQFREKCFELLLQQLLAGMTPSPPKPAEPTGNTASATGSGTTVMPACSVVAGGTIPVKAQLRVFMQRTNVTIDELQRVVLVEGDEVHFVREPVHGTVAKGQMEWALLLALRHAITDNEFSTDPEDVRSICQEKGFYDKANFAAICRLSGAMLRMSKATVSRESKREKRQRPSLRAGLKTSEARWNTSSDCPKRSFAQCRRA